jgi:succinyl-diaminopimelate desuccinylase
MKEIKELLDKLVRFESDALHGEEQRGCVDFVVEYLRGGGLEVKIYESKGKLSVVAGRKVKKHYEYLLNGHLDVVPAYSAGAYESAIRGGRMYARGTADMKGVDAAMMVLMKELVKEKETPDVGLMLTMDEEIGGMEGVRYLLEEEGYGCDCAVVPDGVPGEKDNFRLVIEQKGILHVRVRARGEAGHGSRPWLGKNAIESLIGIYQGLKGMDGFSNEEDAWKSTVNLGKMKGGQAVNVVADAAEMELDFRLIEDRHMEEVLKKLEGLCAKFGASFELLTSGSGMKTPKENKYIRSIVAAGREEGVEMEFERTPTSSDGRFFTERGIPVIMFAPESSNGHEVEEWVNLESLGVFYRILKKFVKAGG